MLKKIVILFTAIAFPINLIANHFYSDHLYALGVDMITQMQKYSNPLLDYFFIFFTILVDPLLIISGCCLFILAMKRKLTAFVTVIFILFNTYFLTISKSFYAAPRPYWTHHHVRNIGYYCPKDYGNPSGHAEFAAVLACVFLFEFIDQKKQKIYALVAVLFMLAVCTSRMYLGGHSLDQVMQGTFLGVSLSILYVHGGIKQFIKDLLIKQTRKAYRNKLFAILLCMHALYAWAYWANNQKAHEHKKAARVWVKNYNEKCGKDIDQKYLNNVMLFLNGVLVNVITGLIFGFRNMLKSKEVAAYLKGEWKFDDRKYGKFFTYLLYIAVQGLLFAIGFLAFYPILLLFGKGSTSSFVYTNLSAVVSSYFFSAWTLPILIKFQLISTLEAKKQ